MKKILSVVLSVIMLFSVTTGVSMTAQAATGSEIVAYARTFIGYPYVYGTQGPNSFDCSGFVQYVFKHFGISLPASSSSYWNNPTTYGSVVGTGSTANAQAGDVISWSGHVAIYTENGKCVEALNSNYGVTESVPVNSHTNGTNYKVIRINGVTSSSSVANNYSPQGALDIVEGKCGQVFVRGWAFDKDNTSKAIDIHVYVGAGSTVDGGEGHVITANLERTDVNNVYGCGNNHGFSHTINTNKTGSQTIYVYAINVGTGNNVLLGSKTVNISNPNPVGALDIVEGKCSQVFVRGWAYDPNDTSKSIDIHVYVGANSTAGGGEGHAITANLERTDVDKINNCGKNHGYSHTISTNKSGSQTVYVYAINIGSGSNVLLGSKTVTIKNGHSWDSGTVTQAATCSKTGIKTYKCTACGTTKTEAIAKKAHTSVTDEAVAPTCAKNGKTEGSHCSVCGSVIVAQEVIEALGHDWDNGVVTESATPTTTGVITYTCMVCGETETETVPKCKKYANTMVAKGRTKTVKYATLKKKSVTIARKNIISVTKAQGKVSYAKASGNSKITVSSAGKVTVKKGLKKGTYKVKVKVKAAGNATYKAKTVTVTVTIKVK